MISPIWSVTLAQILFTKIWRSHRKTELPIYMYLFICFFCLKISGLTDRWKYNNNVCCHMYVWIWQDFWWTSFKLINFHFWYLFTGNSLPHLTIFLQHPWPKIENNWFVCDVILCFPLNPYHWHVVVFTVLPTQPRIGFCMHHFFISPIWLYKNKTLHS